MFALSRTVASKIVSTSAQQTRTTTYICTKPRVRVSFPEKVVHGIFMFSIPLILPFYISTQFKVWTASQKSE